jgi:sugar phosphate isomerase/epimerase
MRQRGRRDVRVTIAIQQENGQPVIVFGCGTATLDGSVDEWANVAARLVDIIEQARQSPGGGS